MANVEIDETELASLRGVSQTVQTMLNDPEARRLVLTAQKKVNPKAVIPELDAATPVLAEVTSLKESVAKIEKLFTDDRTQREEKDRLRELRERWNGGQAKLRASGYNAEGIAAIEKIMEEKGIADHEIAAAYFDRINPPAEPVASSSNRFDFPRKAPENDEALKALYAGDDETFLQMTLPGALASGRAPH